MSELAWSPGSFVEGLLLALLDAVGMGGSHGTGPACWAFILPAFVGFLLSIPHLLTAGFAAAVLLGAAGLVLLGLWVWTGMYQLNRLAIACLGSAAVLTGGGLWRWGGWKLARRRARVPLTALRREDEGWAGFTAAWLGEIGSRGVEVSGWLLGRPGPAGSAPELRVERGAGTRGSILTSDLRDGAYHRAILEMDGAQPKAIDKLGGDPVGDRWRRLVAIAEGTIGEPVRLGVEVTERTIRVTGIEKARGPAAPEWWTSAGMADLDPEPASPLEAALCEAHGPLARILFEPYLRLGIVLPGEAAGLVRRVEGRVFLSTRMLLPLARATCARPQDRPALLVRLAAAYLRWPRAARGAMAARPRGSGDGAPPGVDAIARWLYGRALPDLHSLAFLKGLLLARQAAAERMVGETMLAGALAPEARALAAFGEAARSVVRAAPETRPETLKSFLDRYGHLGPGERSLHLPRLAEDPARALEWIAGALGNGPLEKRGARSSRASPFAPRIRLAARLSRGQADLRDAILRASWDLRRGLLALGRDAAAGGLLEDAADIFFLDLAEVEPLGNPIGPGLAGMARERRVRLEEAARGSYPAFWRESPPGGDPVGGVRPAALAPGETISGTPASRGRAVGRAWVARDPRSASPPDRGDILVVPGAGPEWALHLARAGGLVTERGGALSHLAILAREMAVPAIVGAAGAAQRIATGMEIEIDGDEGRARRRD